MVRDDFDRWPAERKRVHELWSRAKEGPKYDKKAWMELDRRMVAVIEGRRAGSLGTFVPEAETLHRAQTVTVTVH